MLYKILHTSKFKVTSGHFVTDCPVCKKLGHFYMNVQTGLWDCKKCSVVGNYFVYLKILRGEGVEIDNYIEDIKVVDTIELEKELLEITSPYNYLAIKKGDKFYKYFCRKRNFNEKLLEKYLVFKSSEEDYFYRNRIIIPVFNEEKNIKGYCARTIDDFVSRKYYNSRGTKFSELLFNYNNVLNNEFDFVVITEGIFDCLRLHKFAVATFGKKLSEKQIALLQKLKKEVILMFDNDAEKELYKYYFELSGVFDNVSFFKLTHSDPDTYFKNHNLKQAIKEIRKNSRSFKNELKIKKIY